MRNSVAEAAAAVLTAEQVVGAAAVPLAVTVVMAEASIMESVELHRQGRSNGDAFNESAARRRRSLR